MPELAPTNTYIPSTVGLGGVRTSASQLRRYTTCPQEYFLHDLAPHPDTPNSSGLLTRTTADGLMVGGDFHHGMHAYFLSGVRDGEDTGERDIMRALDHLEVEHRKRAHEAETPEQAQQNLDVAKAVLMKFDELLLKGQYASRRVVCDDEGEPVLEREFLLPIGSEGRFIYSDKVDAILLNDEGYHEVGEWKTTTYRFANQKLESLSMDGQTYGHMAVLQGCCPDTPINGVFVMVFVKDRGKKSDLPHIYERTLVIPPENVEQYIWHVEMWVEEMTERAERWQDAVTAGTDPYYAGLTQFPMNGLLNGMCQRFGRRCDYASYCEAHGLGARALRGYRPRLVGGEVYEMPKDEIKSEGDFL